MTNGPSGFSRQNRPPSAEPVLPAVVGDEAVDPLLGSPGEAQPEEQPSEIQRPRGHRHRRTTLPRATRGWSRGIVWTLIGLTAFGTIYGLVARIDSSIETPGKLRPIAGITAVSPPFNTLVSKVLIKEGEMVKAGQPLLLLRDNAIQLQRSKLEVMSAAWRKEVAVLALQLGLPAEQLRDPTALRQLQVGQLEVQLRIQAALQDQARSVINTNQQLSDVAALRRKLTINQQLTRRLERLKTAGAISQVDLDRQREREIDVQMALQRTILEAASGRRRERESRYRVEQIGVANQKQLFAAYDNARQQLRESESRLVELDERITLSALRAPLTGRVFDLTVKRGEMATPARPALKIVPEGMMNAVVSINNRDIGFVRVGMPVEVRVGSFPFTEYGALKGSVTRISADSQPADPTHAQDYFEATIQLNKNNLEHSGTIYALRPGMAVTALLQLGPRPVLSLLGDRLTGFLDSSRKIR